MKRLKELNIISFPEQPIVNIEENDFSNISQYDYLIITIEEKKEANWNYPNLEFDISPYVSYDFNETNFITERKYHYNKLQSRNTQFNAYQLYYLVSFSPFVYIEIASCSSDSYLISFTDKHGEPITSFTQSIFNGKINIIVDNKAQISIVLNLTLNSKEKEDHYHVIKYNNKNSNAESPLNYKFKNLSTKYDPNDITITSTWGEINDANERDSTIVSVFYYYLYKNVTGYQSQYSICSTLIPVLSNTTMEFENKWENKTMYENGYENILVAYFIKDDEYYLIAFNEQKVVIEDPTNRTLWLIVIFAFIVIMIMFATFFMYQEVKTKEKIVFKIQKEENELIKK